MKLKIFLFLSVFFLFCTCRADAEKKSFERHKRIFPRTVVVVQTPRHSPLCDHEDYLGRWNDYPLLWDTKWNKDDTSTARVPLGDYIQQQKQAESYLLDGFAFFPGLWHCLGFLKLSRQSPSNLLEIPIINLWHRDTKDMEAIRQALDKHPHQYRYKGKILLLSYWTQKFFTPEQLKKKLTAMRARFGDRFYFLPDMPRLGNLGYEWRKNKGRLTDKMQKEQEELLRQYLRVADGIYFGESHMLHTIENSERVFYTEFYRKFIISTILKIFNEPEFKGRKLLALSALNGHENNYGVGYQCSHNGTRTLRDSLQTACEANPDVIMLPEWDESNENTSLRPTLYNGFVTKRVVRYFLSKLKGLPLSPLPGDDVRIPNLTVSFRKTLAIGEPLTVEVLNIPDGGKGENISCHIEICSQEGKVLKRFAPRGLRTDKLEEQRFLTGTEELASERALQIFVYVRKNGSTLCYSGFTPVELRVGTTYDYRWAKHGLRDLLPVKNVEITHKGNFFSVDFDCGENMRIAALNLNGDIIYSHENSGEINRFRESADFAAFSINASIKDGKSIILSDGWLSIPGVEECEWQTGYNRITRGSRYRLRWISQSARKHYLRLPLSKIGQAKLHLDLPGVYTGSIDLATVRKEGIYAVCGDNGLQISVSRFQRQPRMTPALDANCCRFTVEVPDDIVNRTVFFHAVSMSGKTWRSRPFVLEKKENPVAIRVFSSLQGRFVKTAVPGNRLLKIAYDFSPKAGQMVKPTNGDRSFFGALGTPVSPLVLRNRGQGTNGDPYKGTPYLAKTLNTIPKQIRQSDGSWALDFKNTYAAFPQDLMPTQSGYTVKMEIFPRDIKRCQLILGTRYRNTAGSLAGIFIQPGGNISAEFAGLNYNTSKINTRLQVRPGRWNTIELRNTGDTAELIVNGKSSGRKKICYPGRYRTLAVLGGAPGMFFDGLVRHFSIDQTPAR